MNDAFEAQGDTAPAELSDFSVPESVSDTFVSADAEPTTVTPATAEGEAVADPVPNRFAEMGLAPELLAALVDLGFTKPTPVQEKTIPLALPETGTGDTSAASQRFIDLMVSSQTGSGKTAAFLLPVLHTLLLQQAEIEAKESDEQQRLHAEAVARGEAPPKKTKRKDPTNPRHFKAAAPGALILCPTRELAQQVAHDAIELVRHCRGLRVANVVGGMPYQMQIARLQNANLVVATPGRLLDLQRSMQIKLDQVRFLVVDEADRMLDLGFSDDLAEVNQLTIARQQTMMFSATLAPRIQQLAARVMREPQRLQIDAPQERHANIKQVLFWADNAQHKRKLLDHWLRDTTINQAIVFASTQIECDGLANDLQQDGFDAVALHGALNQGLRNRRLMALRQGHVQILVATDVAARGIDVPTITHVFNFGLPMKAEDYTHRIGRTGRAGRDGLAVTFAEFRDRRKIFDIEAYSRQPFAPEVIPGLEPQQRFPQSRPGGSDFGGRRDSRESHSRDRKFGGGASRGGPSGGYAGASGFNDKSARSARPAGGSSYQNNSNSGFGGDAGAGRSGYGRKPGWGEGAPRGQGHGGPERGNDRFGARAPVGGGDRFDRQSPRGGGDRPHAGRGDAPAPRRSYKPAR